MLCPICKQEIEDGLTVCPICGADLSSAPAEAEVETEVEAEVETEAGEAVEAAAPAAAEEPVEEVQEAVAEDVSEELVSEEPVSEGDALDAVFGAEAVSEEGLEDGEADPEGFDPEGLEDGEADLEGLDPEGLEDGEEAPAPKKKKKGKFKKVVAVILAILVLLDSGVLTYSVFFNDGNLPAVSVPTLIKTLKHKLKKNGEAYIWQIDLSNAEVNGTTPMGYTGDTFSFYTDPWVETYFSGDMKAIQDYDATYTAQGVSIDYCFDESAHAKVKELAGAYKETSTDYRIKEEDGVVTIIKIAKCANEDVAFVFQYNSSDGTILWEVGLED